MTRAPGLAVVAYVSPPSLSKAKRRLENMSMVMATRIRMRPSSRQACVVQTCLAANPVQGVDEALETDEVADHLEDAQNAHDSHEAYELSRLACHSAKGMTGILPMISRSSRPARMMEK
jgi:hypothetical protein